MQNGQRVTYESTRRFGDSTHLRINFLLMLLADLHVFFICEVFDNFLQTSGNDFGIDQLHREVRAAVVRSWQQLVRFRGTENEYRIRRRVLQRDQQSIHRRSGQCMTFVDDEHALVGKRHCCGDADEIPHIFDTPARARINVSDVGMTAARQNAAHHLARVALTATRSLLAVEVTRNEIRECRLTAARRATYEDR